MTTRSVEDAASLVKYLEGVKDKSPVVIDVRRADELAASGTLADDGRIPPAVVRMEECEEVQRRRGMGHSCWP